MNYKKKILLILLLLIVGSLCISTVNAKTYTTKAIKFKDHPNYPVNKYIGKGDTLSVYYNSKYSGQADNKNYIKIEITYKGENIPKYYIVTKAKVKFYKKVNGKIKTASRTYKTNNGNTVDRNVPNGWKPYSTIVTYKNI